jgi:hypothetical protein
MVRTLRAAQDSAVTPPRAAMDFMGWSNPEMMLRYQHVTDSMRNDIAKRIDAHLWSPETSAETNK